jgi:hypothetical protein
LHAIFQNVRQEVRQNHTGALDFMHNDCIFVKTAMPGILPAGAQGKDDVRLSLYWQGFNFIRLKLQL